MASQQATPSKRSRTAESGSTASFLEAASVVRKACGVAIPVYLTPEVIEAGTSLLRDTVFNFLQVVEHPGHVCLSVDGAGFGDVVAHALGREFGVSVVVAPTNGGKLQALFKGFSYLLDKDESKSLQYLAAIDQDGDHFAHELVNHVAAGLHVDAALRGGEVLVLGRRISRHCPMGFARGELEELADRVLLDALAYNAAVSGSPLRMQFCNTLDEYPDFHSGYKVLSRSLVERLVREVLFTDGSKVGVSDICYSRHNVESAMVVEAIKGGGTMAVVNRSTLNEQPISTFGALNRRKLMSDQIIWPCKRLGVPATFVMQWFTNHSSRLRLATLVPDGLDEVVAIGSLVAHAFGVPEQAPTADTFKCMRPQFV